MVKEEILDSAIDAAQDVLRLLPKQLAEIHREWTQAGRTGTAALEVHAEQVVETYSAACRAAAVKIVGFAGRNASAYGDLLQERLPDLARSAASDFDFRFPVGENVYPRPPQSLPAVRAKLLFDLQAAADRAIRDLRLSASADFNTGWPVVDRQIEQARADLSVASTEEQYQAVGVLCREALLLLANAVHDPARHPILDDKQAKADIKRKLDAVLAVECRWDEARQFARAAVALANSLQHKRTATVREATVCVEATRAVVALFAALLTDQR